MRLHPHLRNTRIAKALAARRRRSRAATARLARALAPARPTPSAR